MPTVRLHAFKQTDKKLRWDAIVGDERFEFYIPKWRVPQPWPTVIVVHIDAAPPDTDDRVPQKPTDTTESIEVVVGRPVKHTETAQYKPLRGQQVDWHIGEPYIPCALLPDPLPERLLIRIEWDFSSEPWPDDHAK